MGRVTFTQFSRIVRRVRYKPGWKVEVLLQRVGTARVHVEGKVRHSKTGRPWTIDFYGEFRYRPRRTVASVLACVKRVIWEAEDHEFAEFFRYKGKRLYDPHA